MGRVNGVETTLEVRQYPDNRKTKEKLKQYRGAVEKALNLARELPDHLTEIEPDPNARGIGDSYDWKQDPPHPTDYLEYALGVFVDWSATIEAALAGGTDGVVDRNTSELLPKIAQPGARNRDKLLNMLEELFRIAYPEAKPRLHRSNYNGPYAGAFYDFLSNVLPVVDADSDLLQTLSERYITRPN